MKSIKIFLFVGVLFLTVNFIVEQQNRISELEGIISSSESTLAYMYHSYPIDYAFEAVQEEPTEENFNLLYYVLLNQQRKIETLIELNEHKIDEETWHDYNTRPNTQAIMYVNHLAHNVEEMDEKDWARLNEMKVLWKKFEEHADELISMGTIRYPDWLAGKYTELIKNLDEIDGIESWIPNDS
ncbi:MAG: hypothetical protein H0Z33_14620 [Bacillaceae bacterium]|nr:hypothetical protein [Bacillaceae bacterium]